MRGRLSFATSSSIECAPWMLVPAEDRTESQLELTPTQIECILTLGLVGKESINLGRRAVVRDDSETLVVHVEDQVLAL